MRTDQFSDKIILFITLCHSKRENRYALGFIAVATHVLSQSMKSQNGVFALSPCCNRRRHCGFNRRFDTPFGFAFETSPRSTAAISP